PHFAARTAKPRRRKAAISASVTVVLPAPERGAAMRSAFVFARMSRNHLWHLGREVEKLRSHLHDSTNGNDGGRLEVKLSRLGGDAVELGDEEGVLPQGARGHHTHR